VATFDTSKIDKAFETAVTADYRFGDFNGDGLTDAIYRKEVYEDDAHESHGGWYTGINQGNGTFAENFLTNYWAEWGITPARLQVVDINGDGRDDAAYALATSMYVYYGATGQGHAMYADDLLIGCNDPGCEARYSPILSDFDGDGGIDLLRIKWKDSNNNDDLKITMFRSAAAKRYIPRDAITAITDGLGARTDVSYLPMTLKDVHQRDLTAVDLSRPSVTCAQDATRCTRNAMRVGRGSPVQDVLAPMYVVQRVTTDAPTVDAADRRTVHYRYSGGRMQAGGRGFLGFRTVTAIDTAYPGKHVATTTEYRQDFPFVGRPLRQTTVVAEGAFAPGACATPANAFAAACFVPVKDAASIPFAPISGTKVSEVLYDWTSPNFDKSAQLATPTQVPIRVELHQTDALAFDLGTGTPTSEVLTKFTYDAWSNALTSDVATFTGVSDPAPLVKTTTSTYRNDQAKWWIGRLLTSSVAHARAGTTITRSTSFTYDAATGLLTSERIAPNGDPSLDLRTLYDLDAFGNRIATYTCSQDLSDAQCRSRSTVLNVWASLNQVHRYSYRSFDSRGRYLDSASEPFRKPNTAWGTGDRADVVVQKVEGVDRFGNIVHVSDRNGVHAASAYGAMGRPYWSWTQTVAGATAGDADGGIDSFTTYRTCAQVACPTGAAFRVRVVVDQQPTKWTYFDKLGRVVLAVTQSHNATVVDMDAVAVCTWYDGSGRVQGVSTPFFLPGAYSADPSFAVQPCVQASRNVTYTQYDALGRPTQVTAPGNVTTTMDYIGLTTVTTNALLQTRTEQKNAVGELLVGTDNDGLATRYAYDPTGNLLTVTRDAGRGDIVTRMSYDLLGRRTSLVDPDAGTRTYTFNAAGEQLTESDGVMWSAKRYDFKGREIWAGVKNLGQVGYEATISRHYDLASDLTIKSGLGLLASTATTGQYNGWSADTTLGVAHSVGYAYDTLGRAVATTTRIDGVDYLEATQYDAWGRPYKQQDATGRWSKTQYSLRGTFLRLCESDAVDATPGCVTTNPSTYYIRMLVNERGDVLVDQRGASAAMVGKRTYDPLNGELLTICNGANLTGCQIVDDKYHWDDVGNLVDRENISFREQFEYDGLNRLETGTYTKWAGGPIAATTSVYVSYDGLGNICRKMEGGNLIDYRYGGSVMTQHFLLRSGR
jgi:YD repeat-containing protein